MSEDATSQVASTCLQIEYDCIVVLFCFFSLDEEEEVIIWSSWPVRVCVCVAALYQQMSGSVVYVCGGWCEHSVNVRYQWCLCARVNIIQLLTSDCFSYYDAQYLGRSFREGVNETSALAKPWTLISSLCNSSVFSLCACACACSPSAIEFYFRSTLCVALVVFLSLAVNI